MYNLNHVVSLQNDLSQLLHALSEKVKASTEALQKLKTLQDQIDVSVSHFYRRLIHHQYYYYHGQICELRQSASEASIRIGALQISNGMFSRFDYTVSHAGRLLRPLEEREILRWNLSTFSKQELFV
jgi:DNA-binding transcriptional ArsR family regulator